MITKMLRFEVFKRDKFTCQYCGKKAPDVVLELEHIQPVSKGGSDHITNLVAACFDCNRGKGDRILADDSLVEKQRRQLEQLEEKRQQVQMIAEWQRELASLGNIEVESIVALMEEIGLEHSLTTHGRLCMKRMIRRYGFLTVITTTREFFEGDHTAKELQQCCVLIDKKLNWQLMKQERPEEAELKYCFGILRNRVTRIDYADWNLVKQEKVKRGIPAVRLSDIAKTVGSYEEFATRARDLFDDKEASEAIAESHNLVFFEESSAVVTSI